MEVQDELKSGEGVIHAMCRSVEPEGSQARRLHTQLSRPYSTDFRPCSIAQGPRMCIGMNGHKRYYGANPTGVAKMSISSPHGGGGVPMRTRATVSSRTSSPREWGCG
jgi:hypothetical protein